MCNSLVWFKKDLRLSDNHAFFHACSSSDNILPIFIWDTEYFSDFPLGSASLWWLQNSLTLLQQSLKSKNLDLYIFVGKSEDIILQLIEQYNIQDLYWNRCYEPNFIKIDSALKTKFKNNVNCQSFIGNVLYEPFTYQNKQGNPFKVFTPFWKSKWTTERPLAPLAEPNNFPNLIKIDKELKNYVGSPQGLELLPANTWEQKLSEHWDIGERAALNKLSTIDTLAVTYKEQRDYPAIDGTSKFSPHLAWGEISPRQIWHKVYPMVEKPTIYDKDCNYTVFLSEIGWRDFACHLLYYYPHTIFRPLYEKYEDFPWEKNTEGLKAWQKGKTGFPIIDAAMRQLWETGWMHNRMRMLVGSFLVKDLRISWVEGAKWFFDTLVDADLASNTMGWQWAGGCGADAAPYFRIFNPATQAAKFDPQANYIKKWLPELKDIPPKILSNEIETHNYLQLHKITGQYPAPIVNHAEARKKALNMLENWSK